MKGKTVLIGSGVTLTALELARIKEEYGDDVVLVTPEEAKERGIETNTFDERRIIKITPPPIVTTLPGSVKSGRERRRERRKQERKMNKKKK